MAEVVTLSNPVSVPAKASVSLLLLVLDVGKKTVEVTFVDNNGVEGRAFYTTPAANGHPSGQTLLATLNTANLTSNSLVKRVLSRLQTDGYIAAGSVVGTPD